MNKPLEETKLSTHDQEDIRICSFCGASNSLNTLIKQEYRCGQCNQELAYVDFNPNGVIRGILGWLLAEGDMIGGRYRVQSVLGKGGFGTTYLVEDLRLNGKHRALKEIPELLFDEYETRLLSRLNHASIPDIIDRSVDGNMAYLVLEFGGNRTLAGERKRNQGRIPQAMLLPWMRQLCEVLIYLHSQDPPIIHRDLKPDNILLDETGRIMLIDFGIAKESEPTEMTRTLGRAVSYGFSPPEQAMGTGTDARSDVYALGATFYTLLTGDKPPPAHERVAGKEIVPPSQLVPEISPRLENAILKALNLNMDHRQQTVEEFSLALESIDSDAEIPTDAAEYAERTILQSSANKIAETHPPPNTKTPGGRNTAVKSTQFEEGTSQQTSRHNVIILIAGIAIVLVAMLVIGYLLWAKAVPEDSYVNKDGTTTTQKKPIGEPMASEETDRGLKPDTNTTHQELPPVSDKGATEEALTAGKGERKIPVTSPTEAKAKQIANQKIANSSVIAKQNTTPLLTKLPTPVSANTKPKKISKIDIPPPTDMIKTPLER